MISLIVIRKLNGIWANIGKSVRVCGLTQSLCFFDVRDRRSVSFSDYNASSHLRFPATLVSVSV